MLKLLKKDFLLAMHPVTPFFLLLSAMVLIPNYPYSVVFFYTGLSLFFTCLSGRENQDVHFSMTLPVTKKQIVRARFAFAVCLEAVQLVLVYAIGWIQQAFYPLNQAGMEPNLAFLGWGLIIYAVFNLIFFGIYYRNVQKVGTALLVSASVVFVMITLEVIGTYACPFIRETLDTKDPAFLPQKLITLGAGLIIYIVTLWITLQSAEKHFERQDI